MRRRSAISNQADRRGDDDGGQRGLRQILEQRRREQQEQRDGERAHDAGQLGLRARPPRRPASATSCC